MSGPDDEDRSHDPTSKKLEDARVKGDLPRAPDLIAAAALAGFLLAALWGAGPLLQVAEAGAALLSQADKMAPRALSAGPPFAAGLASAMVLPLWPFFGLPALAVLALLLGTRWLVFSDEKLAPQLSRINPLSNARQKFGPEGLIDFAKSTAKVTLAVGILVWIALSKGDAVVAALLLDPQGVTLLMLGVMIAFLVLAVGIQAGLGLLDTLWQRHRFMVRNRMSRKDLLDEAKESEGDPHMRAERRQKGQEIALNQMLTELPKADVVIVNPTHYAVALRWDRAAQRPPICIAKGTDEVALRIRKAAIEHGIPIRHDPPTARALHAGVRLGEPIRPDHYRAVAAAIRFAEAMRRKARSR